MPVDPDAERARLHGYIAASRRVQRRLAIAMVALVVVSAVVLGFHRAAGGIVLLTSAIVGVCGYWVTAAHIADWRLRLRTLDQNRHPGGVRISRKRSS